MLCAGMCNCEGLGRYVLVHRGKRMTDRVSLRVTTKVRSAWHGGSGFLSSPTHRLNGTGWGYLQTSAVLRTIMLIAGGRLGDTKLKRHLYAESPSEICIILYYIGCTILLILVLYTSRE